MRTECATALFSLSSGLGVVLALGGLAVDCDEGLCIVWCYLVDLRFVSYGEITLRLFE